jgi:hypothetical protein
MCGAVAASGIGRRKGREQEEEDEEEDELPGGPRPTARPMRVVCTHACSKRGIAPHPSCSVGCPVTVPYFNGPTGHADYIHANCFWLPNSSTLVFLEKKTQDRFIKSELIASPPYIALTSKTLSEFSVFWCSANVEFFS